MRTAYVYNFLIEANIMASAAIVLMLALRKWLRKPLGSRALCFGWLMVAVRLLCPLALPNPLIGSIRPSSVGDGVIRPIGGQVMVRTRDALSDLYMFTRREMGVAEENAVAGSIRSAYFGMWNGDFPRFLMVVYAVVLLLIAAWFVYGNVRFLTRIKKSRVDTLQGDVLEGYRALCANMQVKPLPVYLCDPLPGACLAGVWKPFIALPLTMKQEDMLLTLEHELCHYKNRDHLFALIRLVCCAVHWFNPLVWLAAHASRTDMELRCDERVTQHKTEAEKKRYATLLVTSAARRTAPGLSVAATGMTMTARRLQNRVHCILSGQTVIRALKRAFTVSCAALLLCAFATVEYTPRARIPAFTQEMLPTPVPVHDPTDAEDMAKAWAALPVLNAGVEDAQWNAEAFGDVEGACQVYTVDHPERYFSMTVREDGSVLSLTNKPLSFYDMTAYTVNNLPQSTLDRTVDFAYAWALQMNPLWAETLQKPPDTQDYRMGNAHYVYFEMPVEDENYAYVHATVQVLPVFQLIEIGGGNG